MAFNLNLIAIDNMDEYVEVTIHKPLFGTFCNIRDIYIQQATREGKMLKITIPQGTAIVDPREWIRTGKTVYQVFRDVNHPMCLIGNTVPINVAPKNEVNNLQGKLF